MAQITDRSPRFAPYADLMEGRVHPDELRHTPATRWYDENIAAVQDACRDNPGTPYVISVHQTHGSATASARTKRANPRWRVGEFKLSTRRIATEDNPRMTALVLSYIGDAPRIA